MPGDKQILEPEDDGRPDGLYASGCRRIGSRLSFLTVGVAGAARLTIASRPRGIRRHRDRQYRDVASCA